MDDVKPMTVYRALDFLVSQGLVHRIESMNAYAACAESHCHHSDSQYLICTSCENIEELHNHAIEHFLHKEIQSTGFAPSSITMEIHGICKNCTAI
jgi:Fur family zinc uptake transcriptional regulator